MEVPTDLELSTGEERSVEIGGAGSVGYLWNVEVQEGAAVIDASIGPKQPEPPTGMLVGGSWPQVLMVRALRPGRAVVHLALARPGQPPRLTYDIVIRISG